MHLAERQLLALAELGQLLDSRGFDYWLVRRVGVVLPSENFSSDA